MNLTTRDLDNIRKSVYRSRRSVLPVLPQSLEDLQEALESIVIKTNKDEEFLLVNNTNLNVIIFSCQTNLQYLCSRPKIYVDGTFSYCPKFLTQLFTIHTVENGHYIPLVFILLPNKQSNTYFEAFKLLKSYCASINLRLEPKEIVSDFEKAIHVGVKKIWPDINIIGCRFHLTQSWYRKIQNVGLVSEYRDSNSAIGLWLHYTFGLLFLNPKNRGLFCRRPLLRYTSQC